MIICCFICSRKIHKLSLANFPTCLYLKAQVGIAEIKVAVERSGGLVVLAESFGHSVFKDSLKRVFQSADSDLGLSYK